MDGLATSLLITALGSLLLVACPGAAEFTGDGAGRDAGADGLPWRDGSLGDGASKESSSHEAGRRDGVWHDAPGDVSGRDGLGSDTVHDSRPGDAFVATVKVPVREALLFYVGNVIKAKTDMEAWKPYLAYMSSNGGILDTYLYDTYVILDFARIVEEKPTVLTWSHYLDQVFAQHIPSASAARVTVSRPGSRGALLTQTKPTISQKGIVISGGQLSFEVATKTTAPSTGSEALIAFSFYDKQGKAITTGVKGLVWSSFIGNKWYHYLPSSLAWRTHRHSFTIPTQAVRMDVELRRFNTSGSVTVDRVQVVTGSKAIPYGAWVKAGGASLVKDGDFSASTSWTGFVAAPGFEHAIRPGASYLTVVQGPVAVQGGGTYTLGAKLRAETDITGHEGILGVRVFDSAGKEIVKGMSGMAYSTATTPHMYYAYADTSTTWSERKVTFTLPSQAATIKVYLVAWDKNAGVAFDAIQLNAGSALLSEASLAQRGYETLIADGNAEEESGASPWRVVPRYPLPSDQGIVPSLARAASTIGDRRRRNVILGIPVGVGFTTQTEFGIVKGRHLDLTRSADRLAAVTWFIDSALARWKALAPKGLDLKGFYWMHETRSSDAALVASVHKLLAAKGFWLTASPYRGFGGASKCFGSSFDATMASHFDRIWQQPNVWPPGHWTITQTRWDTVHTCLCAPGGTPMTYSMWLQMGYPACELAKVDNFITSFQKSCRAFNPACAIHANIEWVFGLEKTQGHGRVVDYMNVDKKLAHDFGRFADRMWYEGSGNAWTCAHSTDPKLRDQYDKAYTFVKANRVRHGFPSATP